MVARQVASIEMVLCGEHIDAARAGPSQVCDRVLVGTIPAIDPGAYMTRYMNYRFLMVSVGLIEFMYQAAKAVVLSWLPTTPEKGTSVSFSFRLEDVETVLSQSEVPILLFEATLLSYLFRGMPRVTGYSPPPRLYQYPLLALTNFNERFVLAHEYGHAVRDASDIWLSDATSHDEEHAADLFAYRVCVESGATLDLMPPYLPTQAAAFVFAVFDLLRKSIDIIRYGEEREERAFASHPPLSARRLALQRYCQELVNNGDDDTWSRPVSFPAMTLEFLWNRTRDQLIENHESGRQLHAIWKNI